MDWEKTTARRDEKHYLLGFDAPYITFDGNLKYIEDLSLPSVIFMYAVILYKQITLDSWGTHSFNLSTLRPRQNGHHFADDIVFFKMHFVNGNVWISIKISLKFVPKGPINNITALVQITALRQWCDKPSSGPMMAYFSDAYMRHSAWMVWRWWGDKPLSEPMIATVKSLI